MTSSIKQEHSALRAVNQGLFPTLDTLESVVELGVSQLPITSPNQLFGLLMTYNNTLLRVQATVDSQK